MKSHPIRRFLSLMFLLFIFSSLSYAQEETASKIINDRIDELWTTGKLKIGYANIASTHWLPDLYERNDFQLLWQDPQNVEDVA